MGRGLENPRLITARGQAAGGVKHVYSVPIRILCIIFFYSDGVAVSWRAAGGGVMAGVRDSPSQSEYSCSGGG